MTTQILSKKTRISAIITALVMFIIGICCMARPTFATADGWNEDEFIIDPDHVCTDDCYQNIYYLTDNPYAEYYVNTFLSSMVSTYAQQHTAFNEFLYFDLAAISDVWRESALPQERFGYPIPYLITHPIKDALVIYEINTMMPFQFKDWMSYQPTTELYDKFLTYKNNNCRIMFICNTDEVNFNNDNASNRFLDLVDVHVNTDIYTSFTQTFLTFFTQNEIRSTTIVFDASMAYGAISSNYEYTEDDFFYQKLGVDYGSRYEFINCTLLPHIRKELGEPRSGQYHDNVSLLLGGYGDLDDINLLCYLGNGFFYDITHGCLYNWADDYRGFREIYKSDFFYFVGSTRYGNSYELRNILINIEEDEGCIGMFDKYLFVEYGSYYSIDNEQNIHVTGKNNSRMAKFIAPLVADFLFDDIYYVDWSLKDNWPGRCDVTIKPTSENSWLLPLYDPDDTIGETERHEYYGDPY